MAFAYNFVKTRPKLSAFLAVAVPYAAWRFKESVETNERRRQVGRIAQKLGAQRATASHTPRRISIFVNRSTRAARTAIERDVEPALLLAGIDYGITVTDSDEQVKDRASLLQFRPGDSILVIGGDGLVQALVTGLMRREDNNRLPPIAVIPTGRENTFFHSLMRLCTSYVPPSDIVLGMILEHRRRVDVLEVTSLGESVDGEDVEALRERAREQNDVEAQMRLLHRVDEGKRVYSVSHVSAGMFCSPALLNMGFLRGRLRYERPVLSGLLSLKGVPTFVAQVAHTPSLGAMPTDDDIIAPRPSPLDPTAQPSSGAEAAISSPSLFRRALDTVWSTTDSAPLPSSLASDHALETNPNDGPTRTVPFTQLSIVQSSGFSHRYPLFHSDDENSVSDAELKLVVIPPLSRVQLLSLAHHLWRALPLPPSLASIEACQSVTLSLPSRTDGRDDREPHLSIDGELFPAASIRVRVLPRRLQFYLPLNVFDL